jgi:putative ABC transport system permease protein
MLTFITADLRRNWAGALAVLLLIGFATALGVAVTVEERALRLGSARAASLFDLVIGAPGSETQLVLSSVYLQTAPLPLLKGEVLAGLRADPRVRFAAPVGFGDFAGTAPIIGTTTDLVAAFGGAREGHVFRTRHEAVIGSDAPFDLGQKIRPLHGEAQGPGRPHEALLYEVVGRLPPTGTAWDRAVLVPIRAVWHVHGADHAGHADGAADEDLDEDTLTDPETPGVPAIIVKPRGIADAYQLRQAYRTERSLAVFPAEVLTRLYGTLGNARLILTLVASGAEALVAIAVVLMVSIHVAQRRRQIAALRAFGAPRTRILMMVWLEIMGLLAAGLLLGHALGFAAAALLARSIGAIGGFTLPLELTASDGLSLLAMLAIGGLAALLPALLALTRSPAEALRG